MRLYKFVHSGWYDENWTKFLRQSWTKRRYWFVYERPQPWRESVQLGPFRFDVSVEGVLRSG